MVLEDGKYEFKLDGEGNLICLRYGQPWRDFTGDKAVRALYDQVVGLDEELAMELGEGK